MDTKKTQSTNNEEDNILAVVSWTTGTQNFIQEQIIFAHVLINRVGDLYIK